MGNFLQGIAYNRFIVTWAAYLVEYLSLDLFFSGGFFFRMFENSYIKNFNKQQRMYSTTIPINEPDWENSSVVGRRRRPAHTTLRSFPSKSDALIHWKENKEFSTKVETNKFYLTSKLSNLEQREDTCWEFALVGTPDSCTSNWYLGKGHSSDLMWVPLSLPGHWQLKGFDVPIYTNTGYPFEFDPPRTRRTGKWRVTDCDVGLGGTTASSGSLHPKEPGENATGLYRRSFKLPSSWEDIYNGDGRVFIVFEGVDSCMTLWLNGRHVGYSQDSCLPVEFDVTDFINHKAEEENFIAVQVSRWCDGSYIEDQDKWWLSGIYREVYLIKKPNIFIADYEIISTVTPVQMKKQSKDDRAIISTAIAASITVSVLVESRLPLPQAPADGATATPEHRRQQESVLGKHAVRMELWNRGDTISSHHQQPIFSVCQELQSAAHGGFLSMRVAADSIGSPDIADIDLDVAQCAAQVSLHSAVPNPLLWSAESPNLYVVVLTLHSSLAEAEADIGAVDVESCRVGLRDVKMCGKDNVLCINERPILIAGVNRHEFDPRWGRTVSEEIMRKDAALMKQLNFNAVRCSHYPHHPRWLEICDEAGLYVIDEANIESHGFQFLGQAVGYLSHQPEWRGALMSRVSRMFERDKNATCVIGWSLGNESGVGPSHDAMYSWLRARDQRRFVQYESGGACSTVTDIICPMYLRPAWCRSRARIDPLMDTGVLPRPLILCEYAHAMGNSGGCLSNYWKDFRDPQLPRLQGGFIWDWVDQGLLLPDAAGYGYGGDFGDIPNTRQFCINGVVGPDRQPHPIALEAAALQANISFLLMVYTSKDAQAAAAAAALLSDEQVEKREADMTEEEQKELRRKKHAERIQDYCEDAIVRDLIATSKMPPLFGLDEPAAPSVNTQSTDEPTNKTGLHSADGRLSLVILNTRSHMPLDDISIRISLKCDGMLPGQQDIPTVTLTKPCVGLLPGATKAIALEDVLPFLRSGRSRGVGVDKTVQATGVSEASLGRLWEAWIEVAAIVEDGSEWLPRGHVVSQASLSHPDLLRILRQYCTERLKDQVETVKIFPHLVKWEVVPLASLSAEPLPLSSTASVEISSSSSSSSTSRHSSERLSDGGLSVDAVSEEAIGSSSFKGTKSEKSTTANSSSTTAAPAQSASASERLEAEVVRVSWSNGAWAAVGVTCGRILQWVRPDGSCVITEPIDACIWRAPTDNDRGGAVLSFVAQWRAAGLHALVRKKASTPSSSLVSYFSKKEPFEAIQMCEDLFDGSVQVDVRWALEPSRDVVAPAGQVIFCAATYIFLPSGGINVNSLVLPGASLPPLPRTGIRLAVCGDVTHARWLGLGPHEAYDDRKAGVNTGCYEATVEELHVPYVFPQECGRRAEPRWVALREGRLGRGLMMFPSSRDMDAKRAAGILTDDPRDLRQWGWSASRHSLEALQAAGHEHELFEHLDGCVHVHLDSRTMGVGGYDSWSPNVEQSSLVLPDGNPYSTRVLLLPIEAQQSEVEIYEGFKRGDYCPCGEL